MKSNMRSAGIRKHHRRIEHQAQVDDRARNERIYKQKDHSMLQTIVTLSFLATMWGGVSAFFGNFFGNMFGGSGAIGSLNLTKDSAFEPGQRRDAGAHYLRSIYPNLGTMVSTRDGKIIR